MRAPTRYFRLIITSRSTSFPTGGLNFQRTSNLTEIASYGYGKIEAVIRR